MNNKQQLNEQHTVAKWQTQLLNEQQTTAK